MTTYDELESLASEFAIKCLGWTDVELWDGIIWAPDKILNCHGVESILEWAGGWCAANGVRIDIRINHDIRFAMIANYTNVISVDLSTCLKSSIMRACLKAKEAMK